MLADLATLFLLWKIWDGSMLKLNYFINSLPLQLLIGLLVIVTRRVNCYLIQRLSLQASKLLQTMCTEKV